MYFALKMKSNQVQDNLIFNRLKKKDKDAFIKAHDLYIDDIFRFIFFKVSNEEEAKDLTSEVFLKTWDYILNKKITDYKTLRSLLYKVARNLVIDHYRKKTNTTSLNYKNNKEIEIIDERQDLVKNFEVISDFKEIEKKLYELKDEYREVLVLRYINELSITEISLILDKTKGNTRVLIYRALNSIRDISEK